MVFIGIRNLPARHRVIVKKCSPVHGRCLFGSCAVKQRVAFSPDKVGAAITRYTILEPIDTLSGTVAPWFGQSGGGTQYLLPDTISKSKNILMPICGQLIVNSSQTGLQLGLHSLRKNIRKTATIKTACILQPVRQTFENAMWLLAVVGLHRQAFFNYKDGIRDIYMGTARDPWANER